MREVLKRTFGWVISLLVLAGYVVLPSSAISPLAAVRPLAPTILNVSTNYPKKIVVEYRVDKKFSSRIKSIQYSINRGKSWKTSKKSPIVIKGLKPSTRYAFQLKQTSSAGRVEVLKRSYKTAALPVVAPPIATPTVPGFTVQDLLWNEEFNTGSFIDTSKWTPRYCGHSGANGGGTCHNNESQWYIPEAIEVDGGNAVITTTRVYSAPGGGATCLGSDCGYTSGRFDTQDKVSFQYGYIEARIKMPAGEGNWPAFWMLGTDISNVGWPVSGEVDIAEQGGHQPTRNSAAIHYAATANGGHLYEYDDIWGSVNLSADFHTYGIAWTPNQITFFIDRQAFWTITPASLRSQFWPVNKPYFLILNNAIGPRGGGFGGQWGSWTTSQMSIDYVRAFKVNGHGTVWSN
jgi:beta-glucanase (GH16 family)